MTPAQVPLIRVFISSPGDVASEREIAQKVIEQMNFDPSFVGKLSILPVAYDTPHNPTLLEATTDPQESVNYDKGLPSECDLVIVIFWKRMGTPLPYPKYQKADGSRYLSGTEWEYLEALEHRKKYSTPGIYVFRRTEAPIISLDDPESNRAIEQWGLIKNFFNQFFTDQRGFNSYEKPEDFRVKFEQLLRKFLIEYLNAPPKPPKPELLEKIPDLVRWQGSPFPGLRAFTDQQAEIFFGRGREIDALVEMVRQSRFVAVVSASGAGKSSLVAAGLIPRLRANAIETENSRDWILPSYEKGQWSGIRFTPGELGDNPFQALAARLTPLVEIKVPELTERLAKNPASLDDLMQDKPQTLFFIDQFEELFTVVQPWLIQSFTTLLDHLAKSAYARVVLTMRADFYHRCLEYPELAALLHGGTFPLAAPTRAALREMIASPADRAELKFDDGLIDQILDDTGKEVGALALLAYALDELYQLANQRGDRRITADDYQAIGGVQGSIGKRAELVFGKLSEEIQILLPKVFQELVSVNEEGIPTRKRATITTFPESTEARYLVDKFIDARLLISGEDTLEVAHEALFTNWGNLNEWIRTTKDDLHLLGQVQRAAIEWDRNGHRKDYLWAHERLEPVYQMRERLQPGLDEITTAFIQPEIDRLMAEYYAEGIPEHRRQVIIDRLVEIGEEAAPAFLDVFVNITEKKNDDLLREMIFSKLSLFPHTVHDFIEILTTGNQTQRYSAVLALGILRDVAAVPSLIEALRDPKEDTRKSAADALGILRDVAAVPSLTEALRDPDRDMRRSAADALGKLGDPAAVPFLIEALHDIAFRVRRSVVEALGELGDVVAVPSLIEALRDTDVFVRENAARALGKMGESIAVLPLIDMLEYKHTFGKAEIISMLKQIGTHEALEAVKNWQEEHPEDQKGDPD